MDLSQSDIVICFGRIINVDIYYYDKKTRQNKAVSIHTPSTGLKPDISVSLNVIPSNNVTNMTVTIKNMIIDFDISKAYYMQVAMGYETCGVNVYESIIFRSYQATPNPDGTFVFEGVVVGDTTGYQNDIGIVEDDPFTLQFNECGTMTPYEFIHYILNGEYLSDRKTKKGKKPKYMFEISVDNDKLKNDLMSYKNTIIINNNTKGFATPLSRAVYAKQVLTNFAEANDIPLVVVLNGNKFIIKSVASDATAVPDTAIDIIGYTSASYNGALLSLTMPYYPAINAGSLLRCDASFVSQAGPPNENGNDVLKKNYSWSLYRVMMYSVNFSTVGENMMSISAFPIADAGRVEAAKDDKNMSEFNRHKQSESQSWLQYIINKEYRTKDNKGNIIVGDNAIDDKVVAAKKAAIMSGASLANSGFYVEYTPIGNFSTILFISEYYSDYFVYGEPYPGDKALICSMQYMFPLVFAATWCMEKKDKSISKSSSSFPISFGDGHLVFPTVSSMSSSVYINSILQDFIDIYSEHNENGIYDDYINVWEIMKTMKKITIRPRDPGA